MSKTTVLRSHVGVTLTKVEVFGSVAVPVTYSVKSARVPEQIYEGADLTVAEKAFANEVHKIRNG